jgi:tetratricopeptide (TPR) repeat protein
MPDGYYRASALASMAAALTAVGQPQAAPLFRDAETIASAIKLDRERGYALRSVAAALAAAGQLTQAEVVALSISDDPHGTTETRDRVLADVAKALAVSGQIKRGEALACNLKSKAARVTALAGVARALSAIGQTEHAMLILVDAEAAARTTGQDSRIEALVDVAKAMAACGRSEQANQLYAEAEAFAESLSGDRAHAWSTSRQMEPFVSLAEILTAAGQIERAEAIARTMPPDKLRADTLANLAWVLAASGQTERAIEMFADVETLVRTILTTSEQISALENLAEALVKARQWAQAEVVARAIPNDIGEPGMRLLMFIARALADAGRIEDAEALACKIEGTGWQGEALVSVAKALATAGQIDRAQALAISLEHNAAQVEALAVVARVLVTVGETKRAMQILADATTAARSIEHDYWRAKALSELGRARVAIGQIEYANQVFISIQALNYNPFFYSKADRAEVLDDMARALAASKQTRLAMLIFVRIETAARLEKMVGRRVQALADVGRMLAVADRMDQANRVFADAEFIVYAIKGDSLQAEALAYVGERRAEALAYIGRKLAATGQTEQAIQVFSDAEATARAIKVRFPDEALAVVVEALVTAGQIKRAEAITRAMEKHWAQSNRHAHLITALVKNRRYEQGLRLAQRSLLEATNRASALQNLAIATPFIPTKPELGMSFFEAFAWVDKFLQG